MPRAHYKKGEVDMKSIYLKILATFLLLLVALTSQSASFTHPRIEDPRGAVLAFSRILGEQADSWEQDLGIDMQIVIIHRPGDDIVNRGREIFQQKKVGEKYPTGGILVLVNTGSDMARIVVSHNLEGAFTDAVTGSIAKSQLGPYASYRMLGMAVMDTLAFMKDHAILCSANGSLELAAIYQNKPGNQSILGHYSSGGGGQVTFPSMDFNANWKKTPDKKNQGRYLPAADPLQTIQSYKNAMSDMVGYPDLDLYTEAAQVFRGSYPFAPYETYKRLRQIQASEPLLVKTRDEYAVVTSHRPAQGFIPIFLKKENGVWRVDEQEMYKNLFFDLNGNFTVRNNQNPYMFGLSGWGKGWAYDIAPLDDDGELKEIIGRLRGGSSADEQYLLAELLFRNAFAAMEAIDAYEKAVSTAPENHKFRHTLGKRYMYLGMDHLAIPHLQKAGEDSLKDLAWAHKNLGQCPEAKKVVMQYQAQHPENGVDNKHLMEWVNECK